MRLLVCGGRKYADREKLYRVLDDLRKDGEFDLGCGYDPNDPKFQGVDQMAYEWAKDRGVTGRCYPAHWAVYGNSAGPRRNQRMIEQFAPNEVWAWPGGRGTADMIERAHKARVPVVTVGGDGRTSRGRGRADTLNMGEVFGRHPHADWKYKPPKKGTPWWKQPQEDR